MRAAILSIGDELTLGQSADTNAAWVAQRLAMLSILTIEHRTVADDGAAIAAAMRELAGKADVLIATGGLGPTKDDLTRFALADAISPGEQPLSDPQAESHLLERFARRGRTMPPANLVQAQRPAKAAFIPNPLGTAMGLTATIGRCRVFCLPGPPAEMQPMFENHVAPHFSPKPDQPALITTAVHEYGMGESDAEQRLGDLTRRDRDPLVGITVSQGIVSARIRTTQPPATGGEAMEAVATQIIQKWRPYAFGRDEQTLASSIGEAIRERKLTLATAESCTGGLLGAMITAAPGSSEYFRGGWITYSNQMKQRELGVPEAMLAEHGAVSEPVAEAMAAGALASAGADAALAITGIAGPGGGTIEKPVGTVFIGLARRAGNDVSTIVRRFHFPGDRQQVRDRSVKSALQMLRWSLLEESSDTPLIWESPDSRVVAEGARR